MRILCLIAVEAFLLSIVISESDVSVGTNVQRIPRALVLQPVMKVNSKEEDDGPFDWIANLFSRMMKPKKQIPPHPQFLGPIRVPGLNDDVFIKQLQSMMNSNSRIVIRVKPQQMPMMMPMESTPYNNQPLQPSFYHNQQVTTTKQLPLQTGGFVPVPQATLSPWTRPQQQHMYQHPHYQHGYNKNFYPQPHYQLHQHPHRQQQYSPSPQLYHQPYNPSLYNQQNPYGTYESDNSIPHNGGRTSSYGVQSPRTTSYPLYPPLNEQPEAQHTTHNSGNSTISEQDFEKLQDSEDQVEFEQVDLPKATPTPAKVLNDVNEVYRADRMVPTNPTWKNLFRTKTARKTTTSTTTEKSHSDDSDRQKKSVSPPRVANKYSTTDIQEIAPPDLKSWSEDTAKSANANSDSRMDEDGIPMRDGTLLGRGESQEHIQGIKENQGTGWKPMESTPTSMQVKAEHSLTKNSEDQSEQSMNKDPTSMETETPKILKKVMSLTANNSWRYQDIPRPPKVRQMKKGNANNRNRRTRIVESVRSSVSVTSSRGTKKLNP